MLFKAYEDRTYNEETSNVQVVHVGFNYGQDSVTDNLQSGCLQSTT